MELKLQGCPCAAVWADRPSQNQVRSAWAIGEAAWGTMFTSLAPHELIGLQVVWQHWQSRNMTFRQLPALLLRLTGTFKAEHVCPPAG